MEGFLLANLTLIQGKSFIWVTQFAPLNPQRDNAHVLVSNGFPPLKDCNTIQMHFLRGHQLNSRGGETSRGVHVKAKLSLFSSPLRIPFTSLQKLLTAGSLKKS